MAKVVLLSFLFALVLAVATPFVVAWLRTLGIQIPFAAMIGFLGALVGAFAGALIRRHKRKSEEVSS
jgi:uncharacterized membrane protein YfcA